MADDLKQRLLEADENSAQRILGSRIFAEAADRIEALEAEIDRLHLAYRLEGDRLRQSERSLAADALREHELRKSIEAEISTLKAEKAAEVALADLLYAVASKCVRNNHLAMVDYRKARGL